MKLHIKMVNNFLKPNKKQNKRDYSNAGKI